MLNHVPEAIHRTKVSSRISDRTPIPQANLLRSVEHEEYSYTRALGSNQIHDVTTIQYLLHALISTCSHFSIPQHPNLLSRLLHSLLVERHAKRSATSNGRASSSADCQLKSETTSTHIHLLESPASCLISELILCPCCSHARKSTTKLPFWPSAAIPFLCPITSILQHQRLFGMRRCISRHTKSVR